MVVADYLQIHMRAAAGLEIWRNMPNKLRDDKPNMWRFPEMGVPPVLIHFRLGFSTINQPAIGDSPFMETPKGEARPSSGAGRLAHFHNPSHHWDDPDGNFNPMDVASRRVKNWRQSHPTLEYI